MKAVRSRRKGHVRPRCTVAMTTRCFAQVFTELRESVISRREGIVYFIGLTTGTATVALSAKSPISTATATSVDVSARALGGIIRTAAASDLQVVGQLHTHPRGAHHSDGDLEGMRIRFPGYFSIVIPDYGTLLPSLDGGHALMWQSDGYREVNWPITLIEDSIH